MLLHSVVALTDVLASDPKRIEGGKFVPQYGVGSSSEQITIKPFLLDETPVTNKEFAEFIKKNPQWSPQQKETLYVDRNYLRHWERNDQGVLPRTIDHQAAVVNVSWYAAHAYCDAVGKRLPTVFEWEYVAVASGTKKDASKDPEFVQQLLDWYGKPHLNRALIVKNSKSNYYGIYDLHGLIWEWTFDFNSVFVAGDNRRDVEELGNLYCASATTSSTDRANYAAYMRYALRNSLRAAYTMENLGFRCAKGIAEKEI